MLNQLVQLQSELESPAFGFNQMLGQIGGNSNMMMNPFSVMNQAPVGALGFKNIIIELNVLFCLFR